MEIFNIENLSFTYPGESAPALKNIDMSLSQGEILLIVGKSSSGKTTLLTHLKSCMSPEGEKKGEILYCGQPIECTSAKTQSEEIGFIMQNPADGIVSNKVWHELVFGAENIAVESNTIKRRLGELSCFFGIDNLLDMDTTALSRGQKQLVNLASVMIMKPKVIILDEPTAHLDPVSADKFLNILFKINSEMGTSIILAEHKTESVFRRRDKVLYMSDGRVIKCIEHDNFDIEIKKLCQNNIDFLKFLPIPAQVYFGINAEGNIPFSIKDGKKMLSCRNFKFSDRRINSKQNFKKSTNPPALTVKNIYFRYEKHGRDVISNCTVDIPIGCKLGIVGANGSGKSTFLKLLAKTVSPYSGKIKINGDRKAVFMPRETELMFGCDSVEEELFKMCNDKETVVKIADLFSITNFFKKHPYDLSAGQAKLLGVAKLILSDADILLLDEVTAGVDPVTKENFSNIFKFLTKKGKTIIMAGHDLEFYRENCDLVGMLFDGEIIGLAEPSIFFKKNSFYTTAVARMSDGIIDNAVITKDIMLK